MPNNDNATFFQETEQRVFRALKQFSLSYHFYNQLVFSNHQKKFYMTEGLNNPTREHISQLLQPDNFKSFVYSVLCECNIENKHAENIQDRHIFKALAQCYEFTSCDESAYSAPSSFAFALNLNARGYQPQYDEEAGLITSPLVELKQLTDTYGKSGKKTNAFMSRLLCPIILTSSGSFAGGGTADLLYWIIVSAISIQQTCDSLTNCDGEKVSNFKENFYQDHLSMGQLFVIVSSILLAASFYILSQKHYQYVKKTT